MGARRVRIEKKHPHVRGENLVLPSGGTWIWETPPRAWGKLQYTRIIEEHAGNTPTCVGKTIKFYAKGRTS